MSKKLFTLYIIFFIAVLVFNVFYSLAFFEQKQEVSNSEIIHEETNTVMSIQNDFINEDRTKDIINEYISNKSELKFSKEIYNKLNQKDYNIEELILFSKLERNHDLFSTNNVITQNEGIIVRGDLSTSERREIVGDEGYSVSQNTTSFKGKTLYRIENDQNDKLYSVEYHNTILLMDELNEIKEVIENQQSTNENSSNDLIEEYEELEKNKNNFLISENQEFYLLSEYKIGSELKLNSTIKSDSSLVNNEVENRIREINQDTDQSIKMDFEKELE